MCIGPLRWRCLARKVIANDVKVNYQESRNSSKSFLGVQTVFRFVPDHALRPVDNIGSHFLAAVSWQAVHEDRILVGTGHQLSVDLEPGKNLFAFALFTLPDPYWPTRR